MKKLSLVLIAFVCSHAGTGYAGGYSHDPGCGLGSEIFKSGSKSTRITVAGLDDESAAFIPSVVQDQHRVARVHEQRSLRPE